MTFSDFFKDSALKHFSGSISPSDVLISLLLAGAIGFFILFIYKSTFAGVMYSNTFANSIFLATMITTLIILPITSNMALSLGMVGALSVVRFRTAVKDAIDTMFLFWAIAVGICLGARFWQLAVIGSLAIAVLFVALTLLKIKVTMPYLLVLHYSSASSALIRRALNECGKMKMKSKTIKNNVVELTIELRLKDEQETITDKFTNIEGVYDVTLLSYQGDIIS